MFIGACAGSTGGGIKVSPCCRTVQVGAEGAGRHRASHNVKKLKMDGRVVEHAVVRSINVFIASYLMVFALSVLLISLDNFDFMTNFVVAATINNIGPGLGMVGPTGNFSQFSDFSGWY